MIYVCNIKPGKEPSEKDVKMFEVGYYWYHHLCLYDIEEIGQLIEDGNYKEFMRYYNLLGNTFFPETATIYADGEIIGEVRVDNPEGFALITYNECECG